MDIFKMFDMMNANMLVMDMLDSSKEKLSQIEEMREMLKRFEDEEGLKKLDNYVKAINDNNDIMLKARNNPNNKAIMSRYRVAIFRLEQAEKEVAKLSRQYLRKMKEELGNDGIRNDGR